MLPPKVSSYLLAFPLSSLSFAFPSALPSLFLLPLGWEGAGGGVSQELGKGYSMDNCSG